MLLSVGVFAGHWYYKEYVLPMREARPILKALKSNDPLKALDDPSNSAYNLLIYPNGSKDLFTGHAAYKIRKEFLRVLSNTEDPEYRRSLLFLIVMITQTREDSCIQFEEEDWDIIATNVDRVNKEDGNTGQKIWQIHQFDGFKILMFPIAPIP